MSPALLLFFSQQLSMGQRRGLLMMTSFLRFQKSKSWTKIMFNLFQAVEQNTITIWGVIYESAVQPRVLANFLQEFSLERGTMETKVGLIKLF